MTYDFDKVVDRKGTGCFKYDALKMLFGRDDLYSLWVADMDFEVSPQVREALARRIEHPVFGYNLRLCLLLQNPGMASSSSLLSMVPFITPCRDMAECSWTTV